MCIANGFVVTSDAQVPTVKQDTTHAQCISWYTLPKDFFWLCRNSAHYLTNAAIQVYFLPLLRHPAYTQIYLLASEICVYSVCACCITKRHLLCCSNEPATQPRPRAKADSEPLKLNINASLKQADTSISLTSMRSGISFNPATSSAK